MRQKSILLILVALLISSCASTKETSKEKIPPKESIEIVENQLDLKIDKSVSWVNLMPGTGPKFHISGRVTLLKSEEYDYKTAELRLVKVIQSGKEIYYIKPKVIEEPGVNFINITFSTITGLSVNRDMDIEIPVDFELVFFENDEELIYKIDGINIDEVQ